MGLASRRFTSLAGHYPRQRRRAPQTGMNALRLASSCLNGHRWCAVDTISATSDIVSSTHEVIGTDALGRRIFAMPSARRGLSMAGSPAGKISVEDLAALIATGEIDTVVTAVCDMQGRLVGKRVTGQFFVEHCLDHGTHLCTYLLGTDMEMNTPDGYALMNWEIGYGDYLNRPDWSTSARHSLVGEDGTRARRRRRRGQRRARPGRAALDPASPDRAGRDGWAFAP